MAVTNLSAPLHALYLSWRNGVGTSPDATLKSGLVSDLAEGDFLVGPRATITAIDSAGSANQTRGITLQRRGELTFTVAWVNGATVWFTRP